MLKHVIILILLTAGVVFGTAHIQPLIILLVSAHDWVSQLLLQVFAGGEAGNIARQMLALLAIPVIIGLVPACIYWLAKKRMFPYCMHVVWVIWLIQATALIVLYKTVI